MKLVTLRLFDVCSVIFQVIVLCINDGAVMDAWADHQQVGRDGEGTMINFLADPHGNWTDACGLRMCHDGPHDHFGQGRSKRYSAFFDDCKLVKLNIAEVPTTQLAMSNLGTRWPTR